MLPELRKLRYCMMDREIETALLQVGIGTDEELFFLPLSEHELPRGLFLSVRSKADYYAAAQRYRTELLMAYAEKGVRFISTDGVVICPTARIGEGTVIWPNVQIKDGTVVGKDCEITAGSVISGCTVGDGCLINATQMYDSVLEDGVKIGPFSHVRPGTHLRAGVKVGDFVEFKNADVGSGTKVAHLTYIGDADVGEDVNFGCGTVVSNYDGRNKYRTVIGDHAFIGCNTNLIAPVKVGDGAYTAAGSTITDEVPDGALGIARARQVNLDGWVKRKFDR